MCENIWENCKNQGGLWGCPYAGNICKSVVKALYLQNQSEC